ncbi:hypothetical protein ONZ45_g4923 [Pleurotus djamor]|nr:hypothetical protein ONZ45_g4923 [Pleurotus djamor]
MIVITFIRHGESLDNLDIAVELLPRNRFGLGGKMHLFRSLLRSPTGNKQAKALGRHMATMRFDAIYSSDLLRAHQTAKALHTFQPSPPATIVVNPKLREQHFGVAEGNPWTFNRDPNKTLEEHFKNGVYPVLEKHEKFPGGESIDDLAKRSEEALLETIFSHLETHGDTDNEFHVAVTSHEHISNRSYTGLKNTAWTRVSISSRASDVQVADTLPKLRVKVGDINSSSHLAKLHEVEEPLSELESERRAFFGGDMEALK